MYGLHKENQPPLARRAGRNGKRAASPESLSDIGSRLTLALYSVNKPVDEGSDALSKRHTEDLSTPIARENLRKSLKTARQVRGEFDILEDKAQKAVDHEALLRSYGIDLSYEYSQNQIGKALTEGTIEECLLKIGDKIGRFREDLELVKTDQRLASLSVQAQAMIDDITEQSAILFTPKENGNMPFWKMGPPIEVGTWKKITLCEICLQLTDIITNFNTNQTYFDIIRTHLEEVTERAYAEAKERYVQRPTRKTHVTTNVTACESLALKASVAKVSLETHWGDILVLKTQYLRARALLFKLDIDIKQNWRRWILGKEAKAQDFKPRRYKEYLQATGEDIARSWDDHPAYKVDWILD